MRLTTLVCGCAAGSKSSAAAGAASAAGAGTASAAGARPGRRALHRSHGLRLGRHGAGHIELSRRRCGRCGGLCRRCRGRSIRAWLARRRGFGLLVRPFDRGRIVFVRLAGAAGHILLAIFEGGRKIRIGSAIERDGLVDLLSGIAVDVKLGRRRAARLADARVLRQMAGIGLIAHREEEAITGAHAHRPVTSVRIDAAIDRAFGLRRFLFVAAAASEPAE